jgi:hypothetical protein
VRAESYLRKLAEAEIRRKRGILTRSDVAASMGRLNHAAYMLRAAGVVTDSCAHAVTAEMMAGLAVRSERDPRWIGHVLEQLGKPYQGEPQPDHAGEGELRTVPLGRLIRITSGRAPADLHLLTLVRGPVAAVITAVMIMHWPADGSSLDLEIAGAGPQHLPYGQLSAVDSDGTRYRLGFQGEGTTAWYGMVTLSPLPPPEVTWLDILADGGEPLIRLDLTGTPAPAQATTRELTTHPAELTTPQGERMLALAAEQILASAGNAVDSVSGADLGAMVRVLTGAGAITANSPALGLLAGLCDRLGIAGHGISVPARDIPAPWASVLAQVHPLPPASGPDCAVLGTILELPGGARFALGGLVCDGEQTLLHVTPGSPPERPPLSWWLLDRAGDWHVVIPDYPRQPIEIRRWLRVVPRLDVSADVVEIVVTGTTGRVRARISLENT